MMSSVAVLTALCACSSGLETVQEVIAAMNHATTPWTSEQLMQALSGAAVRRDEASVLGPLVLDAWEAHRSRPPIEVAELAVIFEAKRDSIAAIDVEYHITMTRLSPRGSSSDEAPMAWWVRWAQDQYAMHRSVAATSAGLANPTQDHSAMAWRTDGKRLWFSRHGNVMREVDAAGLSMVGIEDSWLGAGGCIGRQTDGSARAAEHDLAAMLSHAVPGTVVVESRIEKLGGVSVVVLRLGWQQPCLVYLDPSRGFAPLRIDRWLEDDQGSLLARTEMSHLRQMSGGLWLPEHIKLSQYRMSERVVRADWKPVTPAYVELVMQAVRLQINKPIEWGQVLPRWDREPE